MFDIAVNLIKVILSLLLSIPQIYIPQIYIYLWIYKFDGSGVFLKNQKSEFFYPSILLSNAS